MADSTKSGRRRYDPSVLTGHPAWDVASLSAEMQAKVDAAGWPDGLIDRVLAIRPDLDMIEAWLDSGFPPVEYIDQWVEDQRLYLDTTLKVRTATWSDNNMLVDLCADAPERVGDWSVTVERGPNPFAAYRLQERANVLVIEDRRVGLAMSAASVRNSYIEGERTSVHMMSGWRVRDGFRGMGLSKMLQNAAGSGTSWFGLVSYWYVRVNNSSAEWITKVEDDLQDRPGDYSLETDSLTASIWQFRADGADGEPQGRSSPRARAVTEADLPRCVELINRTHAGLDLFRPYSLEYLHERLDDPTWGPKPDFYATVYGWSDYRVIEVDGEIVACGGLWDRGRDVREVWERDNNRFVHDPTALMDFGFAEGNEAEMAELIGHFVAATADLGRVGMLAALEFLPDVQSATDHLASVVDARELHVMPFMSPTVKVDLSVKRPYTDLAYW